MIESAPIVAGGVPPRHSFTICNCLRLFLRHPIPSDPIRSHPSHYFTFDPYFFVLLARLVSGWDEKASRYPIPNPADLNPKIFGLQTAIFNRPVSQRLPLSASSSVERIRFFGNIFFDFLLLPNANRSNSFSPDRMEEALKMATLMNAGRNKRWKVLMRPV